MSSKIYPIGIQNFEKIRKDGYFYIDKTALIYQMVKTGSYYFLSRPRRFGKSLLISTLEAYFLGKKELFEGLAMEKLEKDWTTYPIFHIDLNTEKYDTRESLDSILNFTLEKWEQQYGTAPSETTFALRFRGLIERAYEQTGQRVVILIDEYDKPMLQAIGNEELQKEFRNTMKAFYSVLKTMDGCIQFAFLTGVTKFGKVSVFSDLNNLDDISMRKQYVDICGVSEKELHDNLEIELHELADAKELTYGELCNRLREYYDGYHFTYNSIGIYNPFSLLNTFKYREFGSYWFETGTPTYLVELLKKHHYDLERMAHEETSAAVLNSIDSTSDNPIPVIYQSGYLTIKEYDRDFQIYTLAYPNKEVRKGFIESLMPAYVHLPARENTFYVVSFIKDLRVGNLDQCMERIKSFFASIPNDMNNKEEKHYQTIFYLLFRLMGQYVDAEVKSAVGRADVVIKMQEAIYVFEFKVDGTPEEALAQINSKQYAIPYQADHRKVIKVGVNFDSSTRTIGEWIIEN
mgnify:CR=1 FL=1